MTEPYVTRLVMERSALQERLDKLQGFIGTETFEGLRRGEKGLLTTQADIMSSYVGILQARLNLIYSTEKEE